MQKKINFNSGVFWLFIFLVGLFLIFPVQFIVIFILAFIAYAIWHQFEDKPYKYNDR